MSLFEDETLHMFFDPGFNPVEFIDALYLSVADSSDKYAPSSIKRASNTTQELITRLDYNTTEIVAELSAKLDQLRKLTGSVRISELDTDSPYSNTSTAESKRLEYYAEVLQHSVETLAEEVENTQAQMKPRLASLPLETLSKLKKADENLLSTNKLLINVRRTIGNMDKSPISLEKFQEQLTALQESIQSRIRDGTIEDKEELVKTIEEMRSWTPVFQPFAHFGPVFAKFISRLESEL